MKKIILLFAICFVFANSSDITLEWLNSKPKSIAKDFYIWRFLNQKDTNETAAAQAYAQLDSENKSLKSSFEKFKIKDSNQTLKTKEFLKVPKNIELELPKLEDLPEIKKPKIFEKPIIKKEEKIEYKKEVKLQKISDKEISNPQNIISFATELEKRHTHPKLLEASFVDLTSTQHFYLFLTALNLEDNQKALTHIDLAISKAKFRIDKDKALFWKYLAFEDFASLEALSQSFNVNFYSVQAKEKLGLEFENLYFDLPIDANSTQEIDYKDPFLCVNCIAKMKNTDPLEFEKYKKLFASSEKTKPHLSILLTHESNFKANYFLTPFEQNLTEIPLQRKAIIYALGRQESRFLPNVISRSFALGTMQIMPFVAKDIAKQLGDEYEIDNLFDPNISLKYSNKVIDILEKEFKHPLFVAYAYNGGGGTLRGILKREYFKLKKFEPYLSMELFPRGETREYGKQVLANYYIYLKHLSGENVKFQDLLKDVSSQE